MTIMKVATLLVVCLMIGCSSAATTRPTYEAEGRIYSVTDCRGAANLLIGGYDAADALPTKG